MMNCRVCLYLCCSFAGLSLALPPSYEIKYAELVEEMKAVPKNETVDFLMDKVVQNAIDHYYELETQRKRADAAIADLKSERDEKAAAQRNIDNAEIRLKVRSFAALIEDRFPNLMGYRAPEYALSNVSDDESHYIVNKKYKWFNIIVSGEEDTYVKLIVRALQIDFKNRNEIEEIGEERVREYREYILEFCEAIARTCDFINKQFVRSETGQELHQRMLVVFSTDVDERLHVFYDALLGSRFCKGPQEIQAGLHDNFNDQMPEFYSPLENITTTQGRDVQFTCVVNHLGEYRVAWIKSDSKAILAIHNRLVAHNPRLAVTHNGHNTWKLHILNIQKNDTGSYMCQINTDPMRWQLGYLNVTVPPDILNDDEIYSDGYQAREGGTILLRCRATGEPQPEVSWKREDGKPIIFRRDNRTSERETVYGENLQLLDVRRSDMGNYLCLARSPVPPIMSKRFSVKVNFQPQIVNISNHYVGASSYVKNVTFRCVVEASPKATHRWIRGRGEPIITNQRIHISEHSIMNEYTTEMRLHMKNPEKQDYGDYVCISENTIGRAEGKIKFTELNLEETTTRIPFRLGYLPTRGDNQLPKKTKYDDDSNMKFITKPPFHYYDKTTKFHPIKMERERTRQIESNDVIPDASTTPFTPGHKNSDRNSHSTVQKAKERYEREKKFRNQGDHLRLCSICEFMFIVHVFWVALVV